ncbi:MAG: SGNH/GDSL hydrolase family protein [Chloroflexi bacterium]|nr:SGNH/GDSL hydrolase family protein [Chloroflexota bacterium]
MYLQSNSCLLFIGDSITDCGRKRPIGKGAFDQALGNGFVSLVDAALTAAYPDYAIRTINMGVAGDTIRDLKARWQTDVLDLQPDWLVIKIGINDVWQHFSRPWQTDLHISVEEYTQTLDQLIRQVQSRLSGLIVMTPYFLEPNRHEPMRVMMDQYGKAAREITTQHCALLVNTQDTFDGVFQWVHPMHLAVDRIHLNLAGHMILARAFLQCIGYSWERLLSSGVESV